MISSQWRALLPYLRPYRLRLALLIGLMVLSSAMEGLGIGLFYPLIAYVQEGEAFLSRGAAQPVVKALAFFGVSFSIGLFIALIFGVILLTLVLKHGVFVMSARIYNPFAKDVRDDGFRRVLSSHFFFFTSSSSANLSQILDAEVDYAIDAFVQGATMLSSALSILVFGGFALRISWKLTALVAGLAALRYALSALYIRRVRGAGVHHGELRTSLKSMLTAVHQGIDVIKSFGAEKREQRRFEDLTSRVCANADKAADAQAANALTEGAFGDGALCFIVYLAVSKLGVRGADLLTFLFVVTRIIPKVTAINTGRIRSAELLARIVSLPRILAEGGLPQLAWGARSKSGFDDRVAFEDVTFRYPGAEADAVTGVTLSLGRRETLALVGESGSGKSTLARLLLRLFDPTSGRITVDGVPLPELRREDWTRLVSVVSQDTFIFDDTLANNVRYGSPDCSDERFREALRRARADEFVERMPEKEHTQLGERGVRLSGGQRQRIAIARAFLRDSPILILDEATSAMDSVTERLIQDAMTELAKDRAMLVIAHRLATIRHADRIVVLDGGRMVESGTHAQLVDRQGLYRRFHDLQTR